jgi:hypothetical protein
MSDTDKYAAQKTLFGDVPVVPHAVGFREELHAREKDNVPNPNRHPGQFAPKGGSNPLLKVVETDEGWIASAVLKDGKEFRVYGHDRRDAISNAVRTGEKMGVIFDPPKAEPAIGGLFNSMHPRETVNHGDKRAGQFAPKIHPVVKEETERYFRRNGIDVDRYGMGRNVMGLLMSVLAMHATNQLMSRGGQQSQPKPKPAQQSSPSNQDFEKLHPRAQTPGSGQKPGQFTAKPEGQKQSTQREVRPLKDPLANKPKPPSTQTTPQQDKPVARPWLAAPGTPKPDVTEYDRDPRRGTPEQKAARMEQMKARDAAAQKPPVQTPKDANTARIAEIWDVDTTVPTPVPPAVTSPQTPTLESFTADVLGKLKIQPAGPNPRKKFLQDGSVNPDYSPQDLGMGKRPVPEKPAKPSLLDMPSQSSEGDIFANPAAKARKEKAELDRITQFDTSMFAEPEQPEAPSAPVTIDDVGGDYVALEQARKERQKLVTANRNWEIETQEDPEANTAEIASEYELDHEPFSKYVSEMQSFEQSEWKRREAVKTAIRKAWHVNSQDLSDMENRKGLDHSSLQGADQIKGSVDDSDIYEFLGSDEQEWAQNAWIMLREDPPPKPGAHSKDWLRTHADQFTRLHQMSGQSKQDYPEPEDGMPFSRRSLFNMVDRYFKQEQLRFHGRKPQSSASFWTALDSWL